MGFPNRDEMEGRLDQAKGSIKEGIGDATGDREMENEGKIDRAEGNIQEGFGEGRRKVGDTIKDIGDAVGR